MQQREATTAALATELGLSAAWMARAYLRATGESLVETQRRYRLETAVHLIRTTQLGLAEIAARAGFCDQSHMNRTFRQVLCRTPRQVLQGSLNPQTPDANLTRHRH